MTLNVRFGAIIPVTGKEAKVQGITRQIVKMAQQKGFKTFVENKYGGKDNFTLMQGAVIYTGKDVDRFHQYQQDKTQYYTSLETFFQNLFREVGEPVHERDFHGPHEQYEAYRTDYGQKVQSWMKQNPWPQYPDDSDFEFNIPLKYKQAFEVEEPHYKFFSLVKDLKRQIRQGTLDIQG